MAAPLAQLPACTSGWKVGFSAPADQPDALGTLIRPIDLAPGSSPTSFVGPTQLAPGVALSA